MSTTAVSHNLAGLRVLVVENDFFIADEICATLRDQGAEVVGPSPDVEQALQLVSNGDEFSNCIRLEKPVNLRALLRAVQSACARQTLHES